MKMKLVDDAVVGKCEYNIFSDLSLDDVIMNFSDSRGTTSGDSAQTGERAVHLKAKSARCDPDTLQSASKIFFIEIYYFRLDAVRLCTLDRPHRTSNTHSNTLARDGRRDFSSLTLVE